MRYKFSLRLLRSLCLVGAILAMAFAGCTEVDDTLGSEYIPENQQLKIGFRRLGGCFETRLYRTDSIRTSNIEVGLLGSTRSDTFGLRTAGFYTQFTWGICPDSTEGFGYRPIFDSLMLGMTISGFGGDSLQVRNYEVYEVIDDSFLVEQEDTLFYGSFDMSPYLSAEPAFTFRFPDPERGINVSSTSVKMIPTPTGEDLISRMMLRTGVYEGNNMDGFYDAKAFGEHFKGLYFKPAADAASSSENSMLQFELDGSGMILYGRNRNQEDPTLIQDTTASLYYFLDTTSEGGGASINTIRHDYAGSLLESLAFEESDTERSLSEVCYVEGLGGVVTSITFTESLFEQFEQILATETDATGDSFKSLALNQALLSIYDSDAHYDWSEITPSDALIERWDNQMKRLGLYTSYKKFTGIADYNYAYENLYGVELNYGGYLNRSRGCYQMDIALYLQELWNKYLQDKEGVLADTEARTIYLGPEAYSANTFQTATGQGMEHGANGANAMRIEVTYTLFN